MAEQSLAVKYRPKTFDDVSEQDSIKKILRQQLNTNTVKNAYLFVGGAGTGKTTCARIFANEINKGQGEPTELDAASNNSVDDVRVLIQQAKQQSLNSEYRIFIIDECHALSNNAWQAFLKALEEPPKKAIFIFATTNPEKIPRTILSRVQRYDFKRISQQGIVKRLQYICDREVTGEDGLVRLEALEYLAKLAEGGMRDAITLLDKCLAYSKEITVANIVSALGVVDYEVFFKLTDAIVDKNYACVIEVIEGVHSDGKDLKQFIKTYMSFLLDVIKYDITGKFDYLSLPQTYESSLHSKNVEYGNRDWFKCSQRLLDIVVKLNADVKWETQPKDLIEAVLIGAVQ